MDSRAIFLHSGEDPCEFIVSPEQLRERFFLSAAAVNAMIGVARQYPMRITPYFLSLVKTPDDPIARQVIPDPREINDSAYVQDDPFSEEALSPADSLVHRYPDRVLFLVSGICAVYCRHCMRKRNAGEKKIISRETLRRAVAYIRANPGIREVILSGGDPLLLPDDFLADILRELKAVSHVARLRIHTRVPCVLPERISIRFAAMLRRFHPIMVNIQFNHPDELTPAAEKACAMMADAGIPLGSQTVLLKGVNDDPRIMAGLMERLLTCRVRPYYLHHPDPVRGTAHFRVSKEEGQRIMASMRGSISGMAIPHYVMDLPGGRGKVPVPPSGTPPQAAP